MTTKEVVYKQKETERETVLITGATGFLGGYLVRRLAGEYRVLAMGRNREKGRELERQGAVFCPGDFTDRESCASYFEGADYVIHAGALSTVWGKWEDFYKTNVRGTDLVAELCLINNIRRLVCVSSPSIYTDTRDRHQIKEEQAPAHNDMNFYIKSKLMAEAVLRRWSEKGLETVILRPRGLIGIGDASLAPRLLRANARMGIPLMRGGGHMVDLTSVENAALACRLALDAKDAPGQTFNITNGEPMKFKEILEHFLTSIGEPPHYRKLPFSLVFTGACILEGAYGFFRMKEEPPLTRYTACTLGFGQTLDIAKARRILGYRPQKTLLESIEEYGRWWKRTEGGRKPEMPPPPDRIRRVRLYHCGFCTNNLSLLFRGRKRERRRFPARAVLIQHKAMGNLLFDTGYSQAVFQGGLLLRLYRLLNPVQVKPEQTIAKRLELDGIPRDGINTIILSHAHPDHIGGMGELSGYELVADREVLGALKKPGVRDLVFSSLLPEESSIKARREPENRLENHFLCSYFEGVYDLLGDGSLIAVKLEGHARGQLGLWIPDYKLLLAADACWGRDLVGDTLKMRYGARFIQKDFSQYKKTLRGLCRLKKDYPDITILFTHQKGKEETYE